MGRTTSFVLDVDLDAFVRDQVAHGGYRSASDVVRAALVRMAEETRKEAALAEALDEGLASGRASPGTWKRVRGEAKKKRAR